MKEQLRKKKKKKIILAAGAVILTMAVCGAVIYNYKSHKTPTNVKNSQTEKPPRQPKPLPPPPKLPAKPPVSFPLDNILAERGDINLRLTPEERKRDKILTSAEEKTIIESLASQVSIDKEKFNFKEVFGMVPGIREISEDCDCALYLFTDKGKFFVKINNFSDLTRFEYEKESMLAINEAVPDFTPHPICLGNLPEGGKFLVVNFIENARWEYHTTIESHVNLAKKLAQLHQKKSPNGKFGFHTYRNNQWKDNWVTFFYENRWQPLWKKVGEKYPNDKELKKWGNLIGEKVIPDLLGDLPVEPVLLHGNLDFDSFSDNSQKQPWVFDTHSYYGHNEMDLSLLGNRSFYPGDEMHMSEFLTEYQKHHPLQPGFEKRKLLYQLYHYLHRRFCWGKEFIPGKKVYNKCLSMMKKLGQKYK